MEGHLTLIDISLPPTGLHVSLDNPDQLYHGVEGTFCHISWDLQKNNPSQYPTFQDLQKGSFLCAGTTMKADMWEVTRMAEQYDFRNHTFAATTPRDSQLPVPPTAVLFHESKSGSTVISNSLAAFAPRHTRVYADAPVITRALQACSRDDGITTCDPDSQRKLIQDVFYLLGRVSRPILPQYVFYKVESVAAQNIETFVQAMPHAPWMFAYRDSTEVLMSHFPHYQLRQNTPLNHQAVCLENYRHPEAHQPALVLELVEAVGRTIDSLTREEYCAVHIAALAESAVRQHKRTSHQKGGPAVLKSSALSQKAHQPHPLHQLAPLHAIDQTPHWFINYKELPYKLWETVLPDLLVSALKREEIDRMHEAARVYSHARGQDGGHFKEDSTLKQGRAPPSIQDAVSLFLDPVYKQMEAIRQGQH